jgi:hypothetical protein
VFSSGRYNRNIGGKMQWKNEKRGNSSCFIEGKPKKISLIICPPVLVSLELIAKIKFGAESLDTVG